jgi:hypothetical protein
MHAGSIIIEPSSAASAASDSGILRPEKSAPPPEPPEGFPKSLFLLPDWSTYLSLHEPAQPASTD